MAIMLKKLLKYKWWILAVVVILLATKGALSFYTAKPQQSVATTITVKYGDIKSEVSATGTIYPVNMVDVSSKISGRIEEVKVSENERVHVGQILMVLDDTHLQTQVAQAGAKLSNLASTYERNQKLHAIGAVSDQQLDATYADYSVAQAAYDDAISQLDDTIIKSPIDGVVIGKPIPAGQAVAPGISSPMVLLTVADMSKMQIQAQVDESDVGKVHAGQKVTFTVDAAPDKNFTGVVSNVSQKATIQSNVVYYSAIVDVDNPGDILKPTMTARVSINVGESPNALVVPLSVVKLVNGQQTVAVLQNGQLQNVPVTTGLASDEKIEILSGLSEGDQVAASQAKSQTTSNGGQGGGKGGGMIPGLGR
jgi:HlyD family secretion protein